jgi:hypothetical protein
LRFSDAFLCPLRSSYTREGYVAALRWLKGDCCSIQTIGFERVIIRHRFTAIADVIYTFKERVLVKVPILRLGDSKTFEVR